MTVTLSSYVNIRRGFSGFSLLYWPELSWVQVAPAGVAKLCARLDGDPIRPGRRELATIALVGLQVFACPGVVLSPKTKRGWISPAPAV